MKMKQQLSLYLVPSMCSIGVLCMTILIDVSGLESFHHRSQVPTEVIRRQTTTPQNAESSNICNFLLRQNGVNPSALNRHFFTPTTTSLFSSSSGESLSKLPPGISPFEKRFAKGLDVQGSIRSFAACAIAEAEKKDLRLLEIDFPPLVGGYSSKTQFDDYDNVQELNANRDWCVQLVPLLQKKRISRSTWMIFPDDKEVELAKQEWGGQLYKKSCKFTSIRAVCQLVLQDESNFAKAWGTTIASTISKWTGGDGILADSSALDATLTINEDRIHLICQPGNGGPVEDWINVEKLHLAQNVENPTIVVNGALDKVRDGYYPAVFFPALARTAPFYKQFEPIFILKPITAKGLYGWLYRVYPEPWQVILQTPENAVQGGINTVKVVESIALISENRPTFPEAVNALVKRALVQN